MTSVARIISNEICSSEPAISAALSGRSDARRRRATPVWHAIAVSGSASSWGNARRRQPRSPPNAAKPSRPPRTTSLQSQSGVFQGERELAADNKLLGQFDLVGIPPAPRGMPQIEVTFDIDANGIVNVSAKDKTTGKEQQIRIQASGGLSEADIHRMVREAEQHAAEDKRRREVIEARDQAHALMYRTEEELKEHRDRLNDADRRAVEEAVPAPRAAMSRDGGGRIRQGIDALSGAAMRVGEAAQRSSPTERGTRRNC